MRPLLVAAAVWPAAPPRHRVVVSVASSAGEDSPQSLWTGADDGGIVRWVLSSGSGRAQGVGFPEGTSASNASDEDEGRGGGGGESHAGATAFLSGHTKRVTALVACPGDATYELSPAVVSGGEDGVVCAWSADAGLCIARRALGPEGCTVSTMCLLPTRDPHPPEAAGAGGANAASAPPRRALHDMAASSSSSSLPYCVAAACNGVNHGGRGLTLFIFSAQLQLSSSIFES